jgi:hypothetical protein
MTRILSPAVPVGVPDLTANHAGAAALPLPTFLGYPARLRGVWWKVSSGCLEPGSA